MGWNAAKTLVAAGLLLGALSGPASAAGSDPVSRMDSYFLDMRAPRVYRALAGLGVPRNLPDGDPWAQATPAQKAVLDRLLPALPPANPYAYPRLNHCRGEAPKAIRLPAWRRSDRTIPISGSGSASNAPCCRSAGHPRRS